MHVRIRIALTLSITIYLTIVAFLRAEIVLKNGSELEIGAGVVVGTDSLTVESGTTLSGCGTVDGPTVIAGTVSPGPGVATLTFTTNVAFSTGSVFACYAATHTALDKLTAGVVTGTCEVSISKAASAVPLYQTIIDGASGSDYLFFYLSGAAQTNWSLISPGAGDLQISDITGDSDGDGMTDKWEFEYGLNRFTNSDALLDLDGDRYANLSEFIAGTIPTNPASLLQITRIVLTNGADTVLAYFPTISNRTYRIEYADKLTNASWTIVTNPTVTGNDAEQSIAQPVTNRTYRYYRIRVYKD